MNILLLGIHFVLISSLSGLEVENTYLDKEPVDLEVLPLEKLLEMKKELRKTEHHGAAVRRTSAAAERTDEEDEDAAAASASPGAMALTRADFRGSAAGSPVQTAFQMSLTVLSFLAFGGYVISMVAQNMRRLAADGGTTASQPLKSVVVVNQKRRPGPLPPRPTRTVTTVSYARRERGRGLA